MNTSLKTVVGFALVVVLSAGPAMAGRGGSGSHGGGGGGGGSRGGAGAGAGRPAPIHTPSFSTPRQNVNVPRPSFNTSRVAETPAVRPSLPQNGGAYRPAVTPGSRPGAGQRPGIANTPNWDSRLSAGTRPSIETRPNLGSGPNVGYRPNPGNRPNIGNNVNINGRTNNLVRPTHNDWNRGDWYHGDWHGNWNQSWYHRPVGWWTAGYWAGAAVSAIPWSWGYWPYYNPYYAGPVIVGGATIDYSQPIVVAQAAAPPPVAEEQATPLLDAARNAFMQGDYRTALAQVDQAIAQVPNDTVLHEFRGLALFALGRYKEAAATDYAVLSAGPGWDWTTLSGLYPNVDVYTAQLRALEQYARLHPAASDARFLLADHYLTCGHIDAAAAQLREVVRLNPRDQLSAQLLNGISASDTAVPAAPSMPAAPARPADASSLVGNWTAMRADNATIKLALAGDGRFTWALDQNGKPQQFSGTYTLADNLLVLKQGNNPMMVGQVASLAGDRFNFKLAGDNPADPGLTFAR
ncbi:MAG: tetratricopeptide repeat protein [Thermoguttaceae bacterium]